MSTIPESVTDEQFQVYILPKLSVAARGYVSKTPLVGIFNLILYRLHTGCQWKRLPVSATEEAREARAEPSWQAVYHHWQKWSADGSLERVWQGSLKLIGAELALSAINLDGSHTIAKKGGESVAYQPRKRAKTSNILPMTDANGYIIASTGIIAGEHHDSFNLKEHLQAAFKTMKAWGLSIAGAFFNADAAFDSLEARKVCFNHKLVPNIPVNSRNRKTTKRGRKRLFNPAFYKRRFISERTFAWIDKFRSVLVRFDRKDANFLAAHHLVFALINLRHRLA